MSVEQLNTYSQLKDEFLKVKKRILKKELSTNPVKLNEYASDIIIAHDKIVVFISEFYANLSIDDKTYFREELIYIRDKTIECFGRLNLNTDLSRKLLEKIDNSEQIESGESKIENSSDDTHEIASNTASTSGRSELRSEQKFYSSSKSESNSESEINNSFEESFEETFSETNDKSFHNHKMSGQISEIEFMGLCARTVNHTYTGDPLALESFINSVKLLKRVVGPHGELLREFVISKLAGRALEAIPRDANTVDLIFDALRNAIKPDSSKVIEGRMLALKIDRTKVQDYTQQAEELAEALERTLIVEGISQAKAKSMTIDKTVEMCRQSARSDLVRAVLASTTFNDPKEVVAKFVVETATETKEKQILAFRAQQRRGNDQRGRNFKNGRNNQNGWRNQNGQNGQNNYGRNSNYRGRGQGRSRGRARYNNNNNYNNGNGYQERYVRVAENASGPPQGWRADQNQPQPQQMQLSYQRN